jgi:hypothetical protein
MGCSQWDEFAWALLRSSVPFLADLCFYWLFVAELFVPRLVGFSLVCRYLYFLASVIFQKTENFKEGNRNVPYFLYHKTHFFARKYYINFPCILMVNICFPHFAF